MECAIEEAESSRQLLQRVTEEGGAGQKKLRLGEIWTQLMQAEKRATSALRPAAAAAAKSPKTSDAAPGGQKLYEVGGAGGHHFWVGGWSGVGDGASLRWLPLRAGCCCFQGGDWLAGWLAGWLRLLSI